MNKFLCGIFCVFLWGCKSSPESARSLNSYSEKELYEELKVREIKGDTAAVEVDSREDMERFSSWELYRRLRAIYGDDDRYNCFNAPVSTAVKNNFEKVACLIDKSQLIKNADGSYKLRWSQTYREVEQLCGEEVFGDEPSIAFGSGFAVSEKLFITAGHCINRSNVSRTLIVYGYIKTNEAQKEFIIKQEDIYNIEKIEGSANSDDRDFCVIRVKEIFPKKRIVTLRRSGDIKDTDTFYVIGHPVKLPLKIALNASVIENRNPLSFKINSDTYRGNSGSPVFNAVTNEVEGIVVSGEKDFNFLKIQSCSVSVRCPTEHGECAGETVSRNNQFLNLIQ